MVDRLCISLLLVSRDNPMITWADHQTKYSLVQWNWFSAVTGCTWLTCIQRINFTAPGCTQVVYCVLLLKLSCQCSRCAIENSFPWGTPSFVSTLLPWIISQARKNLGQGSQGMGLGVDRHPFLCFSQSRSFGDRMVMESSVSTTLSVTKMNCERFVELLDFRDVAGSLFDACGYLRLSDTRVRVTARKIFLTEEILGSVLSMKVKGSHQGKNMMTMWLRYALDCLSEIF